mmetsp:Transcript_10246/g.38816  ORF Transcript_10246/g.38816 Transcript_10246/m.38816 type:complete len:222 (+) Transcript_10246:1320-1985(+)
MRPRRSELESAPDRAASFTGAELVQQHEDSPESCKRGGGPDGAGRGEELTRLPVEGVPHPQVAAVPDTSGGEAIRDPRMGPLHEGGHRTGWHDRGVCGPADRQRRRRRVRELLRGRRDRIVLHVPPERDQHRRRHAERQPRTLHEPQLPTERLREGHPGEYGRQQGDGRAHRHLREAEDRGGGGNHVRLQVRHGGGQADLPVRRPKLSRRDELGVPLQRCA